jgi:hypothetical protein
MNPDLPSGKGSDEGQFGDGDGDFLDGDGDIDITTGSPNDDAMGGACGLGGAGGQDAQAECTTEGK